MIPKDVNYCISTIGVKYVPEGHWIDTGSGQKCSNCGEIQYGYDNYRNYCAYCGADMTKSFEEDMTYKKKKFPKKVKGIIR